MSVYLFLEGGKTEEMTNNFVKLDLLIISFYVRIMNVCSERFIFYQHKVTIFL